MKKSANIPICKSMYRNIREKIEKELYPVGMLLPSEEELQKEYAVSRTTVRKAISLLQADGLIKVRQDYGMEIVKSKLQLQVGEPVVLINRIQTCDGVLNALKQFYDIFCRN